VGKSQVQSAKKSDGGRKDRTKKKTAVKPDRSSRHATSANAELDIVTVERRRVEDRRASEERRTRGESAPQERRQLQRRAVVNRRRQIDPTTCERDYTPDEIEFMNAMDEYKRKSGRMFPTCSEVLEVLLGLGYAKGPARG
jgi:hypothetical protein